MSTGPKLVEGVVYVVQRDNPYCSSFKKGDRVKLLSAPTANGSTAFQYEDGRQATCRYLGADALKKAPQKDSEGSKPAGLTAADIRHGVVYVTLKDFPSFSDFEKGARIKLIPGSDAKERRFQYEDGGRVVGPYVDPEFLAIAEEKEVPMTKTLTNADLRHGQIYVVLKDHPCSSGYVKGDRIKLAPYSEPADHYFMCEDGRRVDGPYVSPEFLALADVAPVVTAPKFKAATPDDLKPGAVFKVEGMAGYPAFPTGSIVQHTGEFSEITRPRMQLLTLDGHGLKLYVNLQDMSVVTEGRGTAVEPKPVKGSGKPVKTATRSDGYDFVLQDCGPAGYYVMAGCRWFSMAKAEKHWQDTRKGTDLGDETFDILDMFKHHIDRLNAKKKG